MENFVYYALFEAHPSSNPPFNVELGYSYDLSYEITACENIPDAVKKIEKHCKKNNLKFSPNFTLIYPIFLEVMDTQNESTMHQIAWLIKDEADARKWKFDRIGGYTGKTTEDFAQ